jgi:hypothetical protein
VSQNIKVVFSNDFSVIDGTNIDQKVDCEKTYHSQIHRLSRKEYEHVDELVEEAE